ncbi:hypothetical protein GGF46_001180 [Coemansia sp. RSA 552]|nr:hypothetical protein GGF46_001180 [Coemansia sp. RSA 552]
MADLVVFEDSPLGDYLRDIDATEALVADDHVQSPTPDPQRRSLALGDVIANAWRILRLAVGAPADPVGSTVVPAVWREMATAVASSGHMAEKYTPKRAPLLASTDDGRLLAGGTCRTEAIAAVTKRAVLPLALGSVLLARPAGTSRHSLTTPGLSLGLFVVAGGIVAGGIWRQVRLEGIAHRADAYVGDFKAMLRSCRALDGSLHRALRFVQEVAFVSRGFQPHAHISPYAVPNRFGRGMLQSVRHLRREVDTAMIQSIRVLCDIAHSMERATDACADPARAEFLDAASVAEQAIESSDEAEDALSMDSLRERFAMQFTLRQLWLVHVLACLAPLSALTSKGSAEEMLLFFTATASHTSRVHAVAVCGLERIRKSREAQYTAERWASLAAPDSDSTQDGQALRRALGRMSDVLQTIQAKLAACQEHTSEAAADVPEEPHTTPDAVARLFASLKTDIDMLGVHYHASVTELLCPGQDNMPGGTTSDLDDASGSSPALEIDPDLVPEGTEVFGYTPIGAGDLDASELFFEAEAESSQRGDRHNRPLLDRSERIRIQRQQRADQEAARERKGDWRTMMAELQTAIGSRGRDGPSTAQDAGQTK